MSNDIVPCCGSGDPVGCDLDTSSNNCLISCCVHYIMIRLSVNTLIEQSEGNECTHTSTVSSYTIPWGLPAVKIAKLPSTKTFNWQYKRSHRTLKNTHYSNRTLTTLIEHSLFKWRAISHSIWLTSGVQIIVVPLYILRRGHIPNLLSLVLTLSKHSIRTVTVKYPVSVFSLCGVHYSVCIWLAVCVVFTTELFMWSCLCLPF